MKKRSDRYLEFKNISKEMIDWFENVAEENNCRIEKKEWKSKYNSYVTYDYEPFCSDGFEINVIVSAGDINYLNFLKYLYTEKMNTIDFLKYVPLASKPCFGIEVEFYAIFKYTLIIITVLEVHVQQLHVEPPIKLFA